MTVAELITFLGTLDQDRRALVFDHLASSPEITKTITINCALQVGHEVILCNETEPS